MAHPVPVSAAEIAQQTLQDPGAAQPKQGPSRFDAALKAGQSNGSSAVQQVSPAQQVQAPPAAQAVQAAGRADKAVLQRGEAMARLSERRLDAVTHKTETSKSTHMLAQMISDMEKGQSVLDSLIKTGVSGKSLSHTELLSLQAQMYKYTQELELTGKVVEKATSGLKDTLKTQV